MEGRIDTAGPARQLNMEVKTVARRDTRMTDIDTTEPYDPQGDATEQSVEAATADESAATADDGSSSDGGED